MLRLCNSTPPLISIDVCQRYSLSANSELNAEQEVGKYQEVKKEEEDEKNTREKIEEDDEKNNKGGATHLRAYAKPPT